MPDPQHKRLTIICITILCVLGLFYGAVFLIAKYYVNTEKVKAAILIRAETALNRKITIGNEVDFRVSWDMAPSVILHDITIANSDWGAQPNMLTIEKLELHFSLAELIFKKLHIISLGLTKPTLFLEKHGTKHNWDFTAATPAKTSNDMMPITIDNFTLSAGTIKYEDYTIVLDKMDLVEHDNNSYIQFHLQGKLNSLPIKATVGLTITDKLFQLTIDNLQSGNSDLHGTLSIDREPVKISGEFISTLLRLDDFVNSTSQMNDGEYALPDDPLPINKLKGSAIDFTLKAQTIDLKGLHVKNVNLAVKNVNNVVTINLKPAATLATGTIDATITYDLTAATPIFSLVSKTNQVQLDSILRDILGKTPISGGPFNLNISVTGSGGNLSSIVNNLGGKILATVGPGEYLNSDASSLGNFFANVLASMISFDKTKPSTAFSCAVLNFNVNNGIASAKNGIGLEAASVNVLGSGTIDLRNGKINFALSPQNNLKLPADLSNFSLAHLLNITGTVTKPKLSINPLGVLSNNAIMSAITGGMPAGIAGAISSMIGKVQGQQPADSVVSPCKKALGN